MAARGESTLVKAEARVWLNRNYVQINSINNNYYNKEKKRDRYLENQKYLAKSSTLASTQHPSGIRYCTFSLLFTIFLKLKIIKKN